MLRAPVANIFDLTLVFDKPPATLAALAKGCTIALIRGLNPLGAILAPPLHELVHSYIVRTTMLAPILIEVKKARIISMRIVLIAQGTATRLGINRYLAFTAFSSKIWMRIVLIVTHFSNPHVSQNSLCLQCIQ